MWDYIYYSSWSSNFLVYVRLRVFQILDLEYCSLIIEYFLSLKLRKQVF